MKRLLHLPRGASLRAASRLVLLALLLMGCSDPAPKPESPADRRARLEKDVLASGGRDWKAFYELGQLDELEGDLDHAVEDYGAAVSLLVPKKHTGPAAGLARVHMKRGNLEAARRLYEEVVLTVAVDPARYKENRDYHDAALALKEIYAKNKDAAAAARLRERFLTEFGGTAEEWPEEPK